MSVSFSWSRAGDAAAKPVDAKQSVPVADQLQRVHDAWDPRSPQCAFQHYFYNRVPAELASQYVMPQGQDPQRWERAILARPDPASVPVLAVGFSDLERRVGLQGQQVNAYRVRMHEINDKLVELGNRHDLHTTVKLLEMRERHRKLARRALALAVRIQVLSNRGHVLSPQEELFQRKAKDAIAKADNPAVFGSLTEAWARVKALKARNAASSQGETNSSATIAASLDWETDREQLELIVRVLNAQQKGITFLAQLLADDTQKLDEDLGLVPRKPKQKAIPAMVVAPQAFAASIPPNQPNANANATSNQPNQSFNQPANQQAKPSLFGNQSGGNIGQSQPASQPQQGGLFGQKPGGLFGQTGQTGQSGGLFGKPAQPPTAQTSQGLFGKPAIGQQNAQAGQVGQTNQSGGLFGKPGGLFGQSNAGAGQPQGSGLFGQSQTQPTQSSGLFGQPQSGQTQPAQSGGLFGQSQPTQPAGSGLFGQSQPNQSQPGQSGGLFGQSQPTQPQSSGLFGQSQPGQSQPAQTGLFGQSQPAQPQSTGLFGQSNQTQPQSSGLFGQSQPAQSSGLFGQSNQNQPQSSGLFGQSNQNQPAQSSRLFGQSQPNQNQSGQTGFGQPQSSPFGQSQSGFGGFGFGK